MKFDNLNFQWDDTITVSGRLYPSRISTNNGTKSFETIKNTAKKLIEIEIYKANQELEICKMEKKNLSQLKSKYKRIKQFNKIYQDYIDPIDLVGINDSDELESMYYFLEGKFINKELDLEQSIKRIEKDIRTKIFTIKRICLENVSLILKIDGVSNFKYSASLLLSLNGIEITDKKKHKIFQINHYKQMFASCDISIKS